VHRWEEEIERIYARMEETMVDLQRIRKQADLDLSSLSNQILLKANSDDIN
jgi:hypothetical protein